MNRLFTFALLTGALLLPAVAAHAEPTIQNEPAQKLNWQTTSEGVAFAALVGDRFAEPYMAMVKLPAGLISPAHTKSANMFGVIISGAMVHSTVGADPKDDVVLPEGSFYRVSKDLAHVSKCVSDTECVTFLYQDGKFDFLPVAGEPAQ